MPYTVTSCFWQVVDHWQTLIAGAFALVAGLAAYVGALQAARRQVKAVERQNAALRRAERRHLAHEQLEIARLLDASLQLLKEDIADASDSYKSPRDDEIIAAGDANSIRQKVHKPASFPMLMAKISALSPDTAVLFLTLDTKIDRLREETQSITVSGLMKDRLGGLAQTELSLRNLATQEIYRANSVLSDDETHDIFRNRGGSQ